MHAAFGIDTTKCDEYATMFPTPPVEGAAQGDEPDLCEVAAAIETVRAREAIYESAAIVENFAEPFRSGFLSGCEEIAYRLGLPFPPYEDNGVRPTPEIGPLVAKRIADKMRNGADALDPPAQVGTFTADELSRGLSASVRTVKYQAGRIAELEAALAECRCTHPAPPPAVRELVAAAEALESAASVVFPTVDGYTSECLLATRLKRARAALSAAHATLAPQPPNAVEALADEWRSRGDTWGPSTGVDARRACADELEAALTAGEARGEWLPINEAPDSDDLIWLRRGDNIDGPRAIQSDDCDYYDFFAPCEAPRWTD
jgi:hypothetical protein